MTAVTVVNKETGEILSPPVFDARAYLSTVASKGALDFQRSLAAAYDAACQSLIGPNDIQVEAGREFKRKSAWRKLARHFGISCELVRVEREILSNGEFLATVVARAVAQWGQHYEEVGACCTDEATGRRVITVADAIATASTRASNRAVSNLIAMGEVSAEEIGDRAPRDDSAPRARGAAPTQQQSGGVPACPKCRGPVWDNRNDKRSPNAPDFKCKNKSCGGALWEKPKAPQMADEDLDDYRDGDPGPQEDGY